MNDCTTSRDVLQKAIGQLTTAERLHLIEEDADHLVANAWLRNNTDRWSRGLSVLQVGQIGNGVYI
jgi:hypothetical protein